MSRPRSSICKTTNWPTYDEALKRRGSLTIWFDPEMTWEAALSGKRGRRQSYSVSASKACLAVKVLFVIPWQITGFVERLSRLAVLDWAV